MAYTQYIWTKHALARLNERRIPKHLIEQALYDPDRTLRTDNGSLELQKRLDKRTVAAIIKENDKGEKLVISCWINPPYPGTKDAKKRARYLAMQKGSFWKKIWLTMLNQLGL